MKRSIIPILSLCLALVLVVIAFNAYGWYTNFTHTGSIDGSTKNVALKYTINNSEANITTYTINNLAFFDTDSASENDYLDIMALDLSLKLENTTDTPVSYTVTYEGTKRIKQDSTTNNYISSAYCAAVFNSKSMTGKTNIDALATDSANIDYVNTKYTTTVAGSETYKAIYSSTANLASSANTTLHLYLFGIQDIESAVNTEFIYKGNATYTYTFTITISATPQGSPVVTEAEE